eukprot:3941063-Rhodomonas_salina.2
MERHVDPRDPHTWVSGADVPLDASLSVMSDKQLAAALVHHKPVFRLPKEWWINNATGQMEACTVVPTSFRKINNHWYVDCTNAKPVVNKRHAHVLQFAVSSSKGVHKLHIRKFLDLRYNNLKTLVDLGIKELPCEPGVTAFMTAFLHVVAQRALTPADGLDDIDQLEPDPKSYKRALKHQLLAPFWTESAGEEMDSLW